MMDAHPVFSQLLCHLSEHVAVEFGILLVELLDLLFQDLVFQLHIPEFSSNIVRVRCTVQLC